MNWIRKFHMEKPYITLLTLKRIWHDDKNAFQFHSSIMKKTFQETLKQRSRKALGIPKANLINIKSSRIHIFVILTNEYKTYFFEIGLYQHVPLLFPSIEERSSRNGVLEENLTFLKLCWWWLISSRISFFVHSTEN